MKNRTTAAILSLIFGVFGMQFFYVGRIGLGILMCFIMTRAPQLSAMIGFINFILFMVMSDNEFDRKHNRKYANNQNGKTTEQIRQEEGAERRRKEQENYDKQQNPDARQRMKPTVQYPKDIKTTISQKETLKMSGMKKYTEFDYQGAIEDFGKALAADPKDNAVHWNLTCLYSLTEQKELAFYHLQKAVECGFKEFDKVKSHEALSFLRVQPEFDTFAFSGFKMSEDMEHSDILQQLKDLSARRERGLLTEREFADMTKRLRE